MDNIDTQIDTSVEEENAEEMDMISKPDFVDIPKIEISNVLEDIDAYWKQKLYKSIKNSLSKEKIKEYTSNALLLNDSSEESVNESLTNMTTMGDLTSNIIYDLYLETKECGKKRIKFFHLPTDFNYNQLIEKVKTSYHNDIFNKINAVKQFKCVPERRDEDYLYNLIHISCDHENIKFLYRLIRYWLIPIAEDKYYYKPLVVPILVILGRDKSYIQIRITPCSNINYNTVYRQIKSRIADILEVRDLRQIPLRSTIDHFFKNKLIVKFKGAHVYKQELKVKDENCEIKLIFNIQGDTLIDYTGLEVY